MTGHNIKGEGSTGTRLRVDPRPPLRRRGSAKSAGSGGMSSGEDNPFSDSENAHFSDSSKAGTSTDNHMTMEQLNVSTEDSKETRQLKELLLVHLDLITQQQELLLAKERQVRTLKGEKEAVSSQFFTSLEITFRLCETCMKLVEFVKYPSV